MSLLNPYMFGYPSLSQRQTQYSDQSFYSSQGVISYQRDYTTENYQSRDYRDFTTKQVDKYMYCHTDKLGQGEFSYVYKGMNTNTNQNVAVKVIDQRKITNKIFHTLLMNEIEILKTISSPYLLNLHEVLTTTNNIYLFTEYCNQGDLKQWLEKKQYLQENSALKILLHLVKALKYLHEQKIIHRDIKPANILFANNTAKLADFGFAISKSLSKNQRSELEGFTVGTPLYMSPEAYFQNQYNFKTDIWALGVVFYEMIFGKTPFQSDSEPELVQRLKNFQINQQLPLQKKDVQISQKTAQLIKRMLSFDPKKRININELHQILIQNLENEQRSQQSENKIINKDSFTESPKKVYCSKVSQDSQTDNNSLSRNLYLKKAQAKSIKIIEESQDKAEKSISVQDKESEKLDNDEIEKKLQYLCDYLDEIINQIENCDALSLINFEENNVIYMIQKGKAILYNYKGRNTSFFKRIWTSLFQYHLKFDIKEVSTDFLNQVNKNISYDSEFFFEFQRQLKLFIKDINDYVASVISQKELPQPIQKLIVIIDFLIILYQILDLLLNNSFEDFLMLTDIENLSQYKAQSQITYKHWKILVEKMRENQIDAEE